MIIHMHLFKEDNLNDVLDKYNIFFYKSEEYFKEI